MFDVIAIGDCVIDSFVPLLHARIQKDGDINELVMNYGDKIPVGPSISMVAGNAANNAVGSSRLGLKTAIYTNIGGDSEGEKIVKKFKLEKIDTRYVIKNPELESNHHIVLTFEGDRTILIYHQPWKFVMPEFERSRWVYLTSLSPSFVKSNLIESLVGYLERTGAKLLFNPGTFQINDGVKKHPRLLSLTELLVINKEEAKIILGIDPSEDFPIKKLLQKLADLGPRMVVITDGGEGSYGFDSDKFYKLGVFKAKLLEMTGAGDAFATGTMAGLAHGLQLSEAMQWGAANSASVVEHIGPQEGLLNFEQIKTRLEANTSIKTKTLN